MQDHFFGRVLIKETLIYICERFTTHILISKNVKEHFMSHKWNIIFHGDYFENTKLSLIGQLFLASKAQIGLVKECMKIYDKFWD